jgi:small subunit ribosomal protein S1
MNYGVFVRLEDGIEGLVHISEMSWTKRLNHPSEMVNLGDESEVMVLSVNKEKQEISLGLKQTETNPWSVAAQKYPQGTIVTVTVRGVTNYGAFVEIEEGIDGMIHISDLSWTRKYSHPNEALQKGDKVKCVVLDIDPDKQRVSLGVKQLSEDPWVRAIPEKYIPGHIVKGKVTKLTNFGAFVQLEPDLEGLLHISELSDAKIKRPQDVVKINDELEVKILKVDSDARKIGLSLRRAQWAAEEHAADAAPSTALGADSSTALMADQQTAGDTSVNTEVIDSAQQQAPDQLPAANEPAVDQGEPSGEGPSDTSQDQPQA